ncbi:hypothetical protein AGR7C_Cc110054 [Agrobacterium deltaense Zutra 3/1]|uniref:Uncharacterized protein n=1 Tax=Agrobacterium deltaense Zutra 3/1 TaxID=1183427 RepID=A0A1S7NYX3_9HYPH|nr:hypothetical protein AGR7C_Cc110054 [Agrobacterium deltaense Zutra 3/1]
MKNAQKIICVKTIPHYRLSKPANLLWTNELKAGGLLLLAGLHLLRDTTIHGKFEHCNFPRRFNVEWIRQIAR